MIMAEYISRDDALLHSEIIRVYSKDYGNVDVVPVEYLADIPAADVQPVKQGTWENECYDEGLQCYIATCSECEYESTDKFKISESHRYCERCGADMTGGTDND
jgi:hypothetical protein